MFARALLTLSLLLTAVRSADAGALFSTADYARVDVAPAKTSIYIGTVSMTMPTFVRRDADGTYVSTYTARVFPYFFANESGSLAIDITDAQLAALERGEPIDFTGRGVRTDGAERPITGTATPVDATSGKLKVRVSVSKRVELIFNTTYRFLGARASRPPVLP